MIMPFVRLVTIYVVVILAVVGFFQREALMGLAGLSFEGDDAEVAAPAAVAPVAAAAPVAAVAVAPLQTPVADTPARKTAPAKPKYIQPEATQAPTPAPAPTSLDDARRAYWSGDLSRAETLYIALARQTPDDANALGELGNLYYSQRKFSAAAKYYQLAGTQLLRSGYTAQAAQIIAVLQSIAPDKAAALRALAAN
jgi:TolA-binding protein